MATKKIEIQDSNGNIFYPHTDASVVKNGPKTVAEQLNDIENNKTTGKVRLLNKDNISLLGLTLPCTCQQLAEAMKNGDVLFTDSSIISDAPTSFGHLFVTREDSNRVSFQYRKVAESSNITENFMYIAYYRGLSVNKFSGWKQVATIEDSGWINLPLTGGASAYFTDDLPQYRRIGDVIEVVGIIKGLVNINTGTGIVFTNLPVGFRPKKDFIQVCQGSGSAKWILVANANGAITASRYSNGSDYVSTLTGTEWLPFHIVFTI